MSREMSYSSSPIYDDELLLETIYYNYLL